MMGIMERNRTTNVITQGVVQSLRVRGDAAHEVRGSPRKLRARKSLSPQPVLQATYSLQLGSICVSSIQHAKEESSSTIATTPARAAISKQDSLVSSSNSMAVVSILLLYCCSYPCRVLCQSRKTSDCQLFLENSTANLQTQAYCCNSQSACCRISSLLSSQQLYAVVLIYDVIL